MLVMLLALNQKSEKSNLNFRYIHLVTRQTAALLNEHGITKELTVNLKREYKIEALSFLNSRTRQFTQPIQSDQPSHSRQAQPTPSTHRTRRASVAGTNLYMIGDHIGETGYDHLQKIPRPNRVQIDTSAPSTSTAATQSFSIKVGKSSIADNNYKIASPVATVASSASVEPDIMAACSSGAMVSFATLARENDGSNQGSSIENIENIVVSHALNFEQIQCLPDDEIVDADSLFGDLLSDEEDDGLGIFEFDDLDYIGLQDLFIEERESSSTNIPNEEVQANPTSSGGIDSLENLVIEQRESSSTNISNDEPQANASGNVDDNNSGKPRKGLLNDYDPFKRMPPSSIPFHARGRRRSMSAYNPGLPSILE